jgi:hypothetical protein
MVKSNQPELLEKDVESARVVPMDAKNAMTRLIVVVDLKQIIAALEVVAKRHVPIPLAESVVVQAVMIISM